MKYTDEKMDEALKAYFRELYRRMEEEHKQLAILRLNLFEKGRYTSIDDILPIESFLIDIKNQIASYIQRDELSDDEKRLQNALRHDNVD